MAKKQRSKNQTNNSNNKKPEFWVGARRVWIYLEPWPVGLL